MADLELHRTADLPADVLAAARRLMDDAFDDFSDEDWSHGLGGWHVVVHDDGVLVAHGSVVPRAMDVAGRPFRTGYVESVATAPSRQGEGLGTRVMVALAEVLRDEHELGALSTGSPGFYERLGWERWGGPTYVRAGARTVRTPDEDDGVLVLRFGTSAGVDLTAPIACEARPGDDW